MSVVAVFVAGFLAGAVGMFVDVWFTGWLRTRQEFNRAQESYT
ncbi:MAG: hypothetical protein U1D30_25565 [Planctomycetota bacterium]